MIVVIDYELIGIDFSAWLRPNDVASMSAGLSALCLLANPYFKPLVYIWLYWSATKDSSLDD